LAGRDRRACGHATDLRLAVAAWQPTIGDRQLTIGDRQLAIAGCELAVGGGQRLLLRSGCPAVPWLGPASRSARCGRPLRLGHGRRLELGR
jgi:hypothetical protein